MPDLENTAAHGKEPVWENSKLTTLDAKIGLALNWYRSMSTPKQQKKWLIDFLKKNNYDSKLILDLSKIRDQEISPAGSFCRMISRGAQLPDSILTKAINNLKEKILKSSTLNKPTPQKPKFRPEDPFVSTAIAQVEAALNRIKYRRVKSIDQLNFDWSKPMTASQIKRVQASFIRTLSDFRALDSGDEYTKESYAHFKPVAAKQSLQFLEKLFEVKSVLVEKIDSEKPKKIKPLSGQKIVKDLQFLEVDPDTGTKSINPEKIVGALELWVYSTKTRKLGCYRAKDDNGLMVNRTTILNFDVETSCVKLIKNPKQALTEFMLCNKKSKKLYWDKIKSTAQKIPQGITKDTVLLKAY